MITTNKKRKFVNIVPLIICALLFTSGLECFAQKKSSINPVVSGLLPTVGWRDAYSVNSEPFNPLDPTNTRIEGTVKGRELISVQPHSYCAITKFNRRAPWYMVSFKIEFMVEEGSNLGLFNADDNVWLELDGKKYKALPSSTLQVYAGKVVKGRISISTHKRIDKDKVFQIYVKLGDDLHRFDLGRKKITGKIQTLALLPYHPTWVDTTQTVVEAPKPVEKTEEEIKREVAVKKAEDVTLEIKSDLKTQLETTISDLREKEQLSENTQVDVNAEVMPEVKKDGSVEYNMKVRYDVQVLSDHVKKLKIEHATEDWMSGKFRLKDSQAALQTAGIIKNTVESQLEEYIVPGTEVTVKIIGGTDAAPFRKAVPYDNSFGEIKDAECFINGAFAYISVNKETGISSNEQLAYLRTLDIKDFMKNHIGPFRVARVNYEHFAEIAEEVGAEYRRVAVEITIHNAFQKQYPEITAYQENVYDRNSDVDTNIPVTTVKSNAVAVVIGNTEYQVATGKQGTTKVGPVKYAVNDAKTMHDYLVKTLGLDEKNIITKLNADKSDFDAVIGTKESYENSELAKLVASTGAKEVYFYYSGHGYPFMGQPYLLGIRSNPKSCKEQALALQDVYSILGSLPVEKVNIITDACFSGQDISMEASATEFVRRPKPDKLAKFVIISAAGEDQYANWYKDKKHGVFSYALFKAMQDKEKSDLNGDGVLTFDEVYRYLADNQGHGVPYLVKELEGDQVRQDPVIQVSSRSNDTFVKY